MAEQMIFTPHNVGKAEDGPVLVCAVRLDRGMVESEPVLIETIGDAVRFSLDTGDALEFDRVELLSALGMVIAGDMGRLRAA